MSSRSLQTTAFALLVTLGFAETASAYHSPRIGRWLSRDPVGEPGFMLVQSVAASTFLPREPFGAVYSGPTASSYFLPRDVDESQPYHFVYNSPNNGYDPLGDVATGLGWLEMLEDPTTQPGTTQPAPPPPNSKINDCKDEKSCCMCLLYAENRGHPECFELVMKVACFRQKAPKTGKGGWGEWKKGNRGFCEQAESSTWQPNPIVNNKNYKACCNLCKSATQPSTLPADYQKADEICSRGCAGIANPEGFNFKLSKASYDKLPPNAWQKSKKCTKKECGGDVFLACPWDIVHPKR